MKKYFFVISILFLLSCGNRSPESQVLGYASQDKAYVKSSEPNTGFAGGELDSTSAKTESNSQTKPEVLANVPKLIKNGYLTIEVKNYNESRKKIKALVLKSGGYLGNESETNETYRITNDLIIRIPSIAFDQMMEGLIAEGVKTDNKRIEVQDVGEEYADLTARIETKKAIEKRYLDILNKAFKITDILEIEEKLRVIREEREAAQGRVKYLESQVSFSTINLSIYKTLDTHYTPPSGPGFFSRIWKGLVKGWEGLLELVIGFAYLWPIWIVLVVVIIWIRRRHFKIKIWPFKKK